MDFKLYGNESNPNSASLAKNPSYSRLVEGLSARG